MSGAVRRGDALVLVDAIADFGHRDGKALLDAYRAAHRALTGAIGAARARGLPIVYANDDFGSWSGDRSAVLEHALRRTEEPDLLRDVAPSPEDAFLCKPRYSAFDHTALTLLLEDRSIRRLLVAGTATEMCVTQTTIDARERGYQVSVLVDACSSVNADDAALALRYLERVAGAKLHRGVGTLPATS